MSNDLKLLVQWSDPWEEFRTALRPALSRSETPLAGEAHTGLWPFRGMATTWLVEAFFLVLIIVLPGKYAALHPDVAKGAPKYDVLYYYAGEELPQLRDQGGARAGKSGKAGGKEAFHRTQTIKVARGESAVNKVVDAPDIKLPVSTDPVKNLIAVNRLPGPPPAEGLRASHTTPSLSKDAIVAPPPSVLQKLERNTPKLPNSVIAPPPSSMTSSRQVAGMTANVIAPPPSDVSPDRHAPTGSLATTIISPAPTNVARQYPNAILPMDTPIIPPSPRADVRRDAPTLTGPTAQNRTVVPPPVSAPERTSNSNAKLTLPAQPIIGPPPSQVVRDQHSVTGVALGDPNKVVPPPVSDPAQTQHISNAMIGTAQIVPPPPSVGGGSSLSGSGGRSNSHGVAGGSLGAANVIPPPPNVGGSGSLSGSGRDAASLTGSMSGSPIPPPPNATGSGSGSGRTLTASLGGGGIVPPPPNAASGALSGRGSGNKGSGLGGLMDAGSVEAPKGGGGGTNNGKGLVISDNPGSALGKPGSGGAGSIAMSPAGGSQPGLGGNGGGDGIGRGKGPGSGLNGEGPGASKEGTGRGSDPNAKGGISPYPGSGGAGTGMDGQPVMPGTSVEGGHNVVNLPSFGDSGGNPNSPGHSGMGPGGKGGFDVTVVATSRAGGAFNNYGEFKADKVYTKYLETPAGRVSMQYFDADSVSHPYSEVLVDPVPIRIDLPTGLGKARLVIACILDRTGILRNLHVVEGGTPTMTSKVMAALPSWKFQPALHGKTPIDVNARLGFNIDTN